MIMANNSIVVFSGISQSIKEEAKEEAARQIKRLADTMSHMRVSPAEVAKETGLSRQTVYRVLGGTPAKLETVIAIERAVTGIVKSRMQAVSAIMSVEVPVKTENSSNSEI